MTTFALRLLTPTENLIFSRLTSFHPVSMSRSSLVCPFKEMVNTAGIPSAFAFTTALQVRGPRLLIS